jgi:hypothetical protein
MPLSYRQRLFAALAITLLVVPAPALSYQRLLHVSHSPHGLDRDHSDATALQAGESAAQVRSLGESRRSPTPLSTLAGALAFRAEAPLLSTSSRLLEETRTRHFGQRARPAQSRAPPLV